ncbi:hypothetical protein Lbys_2375 [Leadbetterella byssophila DSM 17132]|uniref:Uncharacterized protein n=1 Tax=Leadbetterella byssophila (strain DSM 17132 / JCM 16389 / KACC 11308 / NBRC 106382 / 4M15) TaxID=649349 RepID=E4RX12_LEAB4|nr:hypothetical protein Lbys_2375 [Leadbetterella byssophila DSM 17132]
MTVIFCPKSQRLFGSSSLKKKLPLTEFYGPFERSERGHHEIHGFWLLSVSIALSKSYW